MNRRPGRVWCGLYIVALFVLLFVQAPGMALGAMLRSRGFLWAAWTVAILIGGWAAFR